MNVEVKAMTISYSIRGFVVHDELVIHEVETVRFGFVGIIDDLID